MALRGSGEPHSKAETAGRSASPRWPPISRTIVSCFKIRWRGALAECPHGVVPRLLIMRFFRFVGPASRNLFRESFGAVTGMSTKHGAHKRSTIGLHQWDWMIPTAATCGLPSPGILSASLAPTMISTPARI